MHYLSFFFFFNHGFKFKDSVYNDCHDLTMLSVNIIDIAIITVKNVDYHCIIDNISKSVAINLLEITVLAKRGYIYKILFEFSVYLRFFFCLVCLKWLILLTSKSI